MSNLKKKLIILVLVVIILITYSMLFAKKLNCIMIIDKDRYSAEYSNVSFNITLVKLPFRYLFAYGDIVIDNYKIPLGTFLYGRYQIVKDNRDNFVRLHFYNKNYHNDKPTTTKFNISAGFIYLDKRSNNLDFYYASVFFIRTKLNTTMTQSFSLDGKLAER